MSDEIARLERVMDSRFAMTDLLDDIKGTISDCYRACEDYHPSGVVVRLSVDKRGEPR